MAHLLSSADISISLPEISKFCYIKKYRYRKLLILPLFLESLRTVLINMVPIFMMSAKLAILAFLKIKVF